MVPGGKLTGCNTPLVFPENDIDPFLFHVKPCFLEGLPVSDPDQVITLFTGTQLFVLPYPVDILYIDEKTPPVESPV
jgi:hypothetical protein